MDENTELGVAKPFGKPIVFRDVVPIGLKHFRAFWGSDRINVYRLFFTAPARNGNT
jgi:hypothetical protein